MKVLIAAIIASILGMVVFYVFFDLVGSQMFLKNYYLAKVHFWRHPNFLSRDTGRLAKYFLVFFFTNLIWSYIFVQRQRAFEGSGIEKGIKFFLLLWLLTIPIHLWYWVLIPYSKKILLYNIFVYYPVLSLATGAAIGKVCSEE